MTTSKAFRLRRLVLAGTLLGLSQSCSKKAEADFWSLPAPKPLPVAQRIGFPPYRADEHGKFVEVCFDRAPTERELDPFTMTIATTTGRKAECRGHFSYDVRAQTQSTCQRYNMFVYCLGKNASAEERDTIETHVKAGSLREVTFTVSSSTGTRTASQQFRDL